MLETETGGWTVKQSNHWYGVDNLAQNAETDAVRLNGADVGAPPPLRLELDTWLVRHAQELMERCLSAMP